MSDKLSINSTSPQVIQVPWTPSNVHNTLPDNIGEKMMIKRIFAGCEQCFVYLLDESNGEKPDDYREYSVDSQIAYFTVALSKHCAEIEKSATLDFVSIFLLNLLQSTI